MTLSAQAKTELTWWIDNVLPASTPISHGNPDLTLTTDASNLGWGAVCGDTSTEGFWSLEEQGNHINFLELKAVLLGLKSLCSAFSKKHVLIQSDNTTAVAYINAMGGIKSIPCNEMAIMIWDWCLNHNIWLSATHIPGSKNIQANKESRALKESTEWSLSLEVFNVIQERWGKFDIDLFASRLNIKVLQYVSWRPDPGAQFINAFLMNWKRYYFYAFPPFSLLATCLQKIEQDQSTGILIVPMWTTQPWFTILLNLLTDNLLALPQTDSLLFLPHSNAIHPLSRRLQLMACKVSGSPSSRDISSKATNIILQSWSTGTQKQYNIKKWHEFCSKWEVNSYNPHLNTVLDFLVSLHEQGLSYTTIKTARSALSAIILPTDNVNIGSHPIVSHFMKGIFKSNPPVPRSRTTWNVSAVLSYLSSLPKPPQSSLKSLTLKLAMLIALVSAQRGQSLHMLDIQFMKEGDSFFEFALPEHIKQSRPGYKEPSVLLQAYPADQPLCVFTHLKEYLKRTKLLRGTETKLFLSHAKPHHRTSRDTISRWIRSVMAEAGVDVTTFKPHSTRAAAASKAKNASVPLKEILDTAGWSSERTFDHFYN